jgi:hypothetical protein
VIAHRFDGVRRFAARTGDTCIVEEDYGTALGKPVRHKRIPVVKAAAEVLKEDKRRSAFRAEAPVCVTDSISLDEAGRCRDVGVFRHIYLLACRSGCYVRNDAMSAIWILVPSSATAGRAAAIRLQADSSGVLPFIIQEFREICLPLPDQGVTLPVTYDRNSPAKPPHRLCPRQHRGPDARQPA